MYVYKTDELLARGYRIENVQIENVSLMYEDHGFLTLELGIQGATWGCCFGGYALGTKNILSGGKKEYSCSDKGIEVIMRIMDTIGVDDLFKLRGKYARAAFKGRGATPVEYIGNLIEDKWFSYREFFSEETANG